jgi:RNA polymerase sigma factor (sigma-70 family)
MEEETLRQLILNAQESYSIRGTKRKRKAIDTSYQILYDYVSHFLKTIAKIHGKGMNTQDVESATNEAFLQSVSKYSAEKGSAIQFIGILIKRRLVSLRRYNTFQCRNPKRCVNDLTAVEQYGVTHKCELSENEEVNKLWKSIIPLLTRQELTIFTLITDGLTHSEISIKLNISKKTVSNEIVSARNKIKEQLPHLREI